MFEVLSQDLTPAELDLDQLYLDPNNPRLVSISHVTTSDKEALSDGVQSSLRAEIKRHFSIGGLMDSMEISGYLPIDRVVVRAVLEDAYIVLEGNRRIAAAKELYDRHQDGRSELDPEVLESLSSVPVLVYTGTDPKAAWIFQGIRHISGVKDWPAYNKARLLVEQMEENDLNFTEAGRAFGLTSHQAGQYVRGYYAFSVAADHPDFNEDVDERLFPYLQELFGRSNIPLREWLGWDDASHTFADEQAFHELLEWFYVKVDDNGEFDPDAPAEWDSRRVPRAIDLREISELASDFPDEFVAFRRGTPLSTAVARARARQEQEAETSEEVLSELEEMRDFLSRLPVIQLQDSPIAVRVSEMLKSIEVTAGRSAALVSSAPDS